MKVCDCMSRNIAVAAPDTPIRDAAQMMDDIDTGILPVARDQRIVGVVTDRDIVVRGVARGLGPETTVDQVMSTEIEIVTEEDDLDEVALRMADLQVRRMPVVGEDGKLIGVISLADITRSHDNRGADRAAAALSGIEQPSRQHNP